MAETNKRLYNVYHSGLIYEDEGLFYWSLTIGWAGREITIFSRDTGIPASSHCQDALFQLKDFFNENVCSFNIEIKQSFPAKLKVIYTGNINGCRQEKIHA